MKLWQKRVKTVGDYRYNKKLRVIHFCEKFIDSNGYVRVGYAMDKILSDEEKVGLNMAFKKAVSSSMTNTGKYLREVTADKVDYDIFPNPNYELTKTQKKTLWISVGVAILALFVSAINVWITWKNSKKEPVKIEIKLPQEEAKNVNIKSLRIDTVIYPQSPIPKVK